MVTGFTATEYGDFLIAKLNDPYYNTVRVTDWEIVAGVQSFKTVGTISTQSGSLSVNGNFTDFSNFIPGDSIIIGNTTFVIDTIVTQSELTLTTAPDFTTSGIEFYTPPNANNFFEYEYRWSSDNVQFSELRPLNTTQGISDLMGLNFDSTTPLWIDVKAEVAAITTGYTISIISVTYTIETVDGTVVSCPQFCVECTDPFAMYGCANIIECVDDNLFNPYDLNKSTNLYEQLVGMTSNIFGHDVQYFRTEPDARTEDVHLMEYSLHNVIDKKTVKVLVPDNEFPEESMTYDIFGMEFAEFEIHITAAEFETVFGLGKSPRNKDYMYIPLINRMYEINSLSIADEFNQTSSYWRCKLVKYQERSSVIKNQFEVDTDNLTTGVEEIFGERQREEQEKVTNPQQFQTVSTFYRDGIRGFIDSSLSIKDHDLKNRWTVVSKNYYDLSKIDTQKIALEYQVASKLKSSDNLATSLWFNPQLASTDTAEYVLFGDIAAIGGFKLYYSNTKFKVSANGIDHEFTHGVTLQKGEWYGLVFNINNKFFQISLSLYRLDPSNNTGTAAGSRPQDSNNNLIEEYTETIEAGQPLQWNSDANYHIRGNKTFMTNIRVFTNVIELEQHSNVLNQYVVRDNQLSILIDNAIPSLGYQRFKNAR
tara:strand:+ start:5695 stop:7644 length:1950 start_codon:yes stop_codon:yes gene_type:complete